MLSRNCCSFIEIFLKTFIHPPTHFVFTLFKAFKSKKFFSCKRSATKKILNHFFGAHIKSIGLAPMP